MAGKTNPADIFTKEDNDVSHYCGLRDLMVVSREKFWNPDSLTEGRWGVLKRGSTDQPESQSVTESEILTQPQKEVLTQSQLKYICHIPSTKIGGQGAPMNEFNEIISLLITF